MSELTRGEPLFHETDSQARTRTRKITFRFSANHEQYCQLYLVDPYSCYMRNYIYIRIHIIIHVRTPPHMNEREPISMYDMVYYTICMVRSCSRGRVSINNLCMVANPARGQPKRKKCFFFCPCWRLITCFEWFVLCVGTSW